ncbi:MAG: c-type cytochrome [Pseudomonadota bacterium]|nr:c-type cytochrome [Pseudomonadota bacterium]
MGRDTAARITPAIGAVFLLTLGCGPVRANDMLAYGQHLAGECTSCHRIDGKDKGIPSIIGWHEDSFIAVLKSYKSGERENKAMVSVARSLDDQQMQALATYFGSLRLR